MVLHLLGKKSWHVYNSANVERVRRDEAAAQAREAAAEQRSLEQDARRRMRLLRGEAVEEEEDGVRGSEARLDSRRGEEEQRSPRNQVHDRHDRPRKRRRGEDDTDRDIRVAREVVGRDGDDEGDSPIAAAKQVMLLQERERDAPLQDHAGHFQLIPAPDEARLLQTSRKRSERGLEPSEDRRRHRRRDDDEQQEDGARSKADDEQAGGMRFSDAAGYGKGVARPWYASASAPSTSSSAPAAVELLPLSAAPVHDVFGREDPRRREREGARITSSDPFAAMQQAQRQLKQSVRDKAAWQQAREKEVEGLAAAAGVVSPPREARRREKAYRHRRRSRSRSRSRSRERGERRRERNQEGHRHQRGEYEDDRDSLEGFSLDADANATAPTSQQQKGASDRHHGRERSRRRHRDQERDDEHPHRDPHRRREHRRHRSRSRSRDARRDGRGS